MELPCVFLVPSLAFPQFTGNLVALHNALSPILAAIFAGNGIVVKCSEHVVWSTSWFVGAVQECLRVCEWDADLVQVGNTIQLSFSPLWAGRVVRLLLWRSYTYLLPV